MTHFVNINLKGIQIEIKKILPKSFRKVWFSTKFEVSPCKQKFQQ